MLHSIDFLPAPKEQQKNSFLSAHQDHTVHNDDLSNSDFAAALAQLFGVPVTHEHAANAPRPLDSQQGLQHRAKQEQAPLFVPHHHLNQAAQPLPVHTPSLSLQSAPEALSVAKHTHLSIQQQTQWAAQSRPLQPALSASPSLPPSSTSTPDLKEHAHSLTQVRPQTAPFNTSSSAFTGSHTPRKEHASSVLLGQTPRADQSAYTQTVSFDKFESTQEFRALINDSTQPAETNSGQAINRAESPSLFASPLSSGLNWATPAPSPLHAPSPVPVVDHNVALDLQHPQWAQQLGKNLLRMSTQHASGQSMAQIRLDPPHLGPLQISLHIQEGQIHAQFFSPHAFVRHSIEQALPQLFEQFNQAGLTLGQTFVGSEQHFSQKQHFTGNQKQPSMARSPASSTVPHETPPSTTVSVRHPNSTINTFA